MTQPPYLGQGKPPSTDFGATTVSGAPVTNRDSASAADRPADGPADPSARTAAVPVAPAPSAPGAGAPTPPKPGAPSNPVASGAGPTRSGRAERVRGPRRARLQLRHINPWTVLKFSCVLSIALFFVWLIVVGVLYGVLEASGVVEKVNDTVTTINGPGSKAPITAGVVFGGAAIVGIVNIVLFIALSTIGSVVYNLCADLVGGVELTLSER